MKGRTLFRLVLLVVAVLIGAYNSGYFKGRQNSPPQHDGPLVVHVPPEAVAPRSTAPPADASRDATAGRDLERDEVRGGHTLARHVGKSDDELRDRLDRERRISAASTYADRATAARVVAATIGREGRRIADWAARTGSRPNLALDYRGDRATVIGRSIAQGRSTAEPCHDAVVVLRWDTRADSYYVLTSYPEVRRGSR